MSLHQVTTRFSRRRVHSRTYVFIGIDLSTLGAKQFPCRTLLLHRIRAEHAPHSIKMLARSINQKE
jgi:hypothetical protein